MKLVEATDVATDGGSDVDDGIASSSESDRGEEAVVGTIYSQTEDLRELE